MLRLLGLLGMLGLLGLLGLLGHIKIKFIFREKKHKNMLFLGVFSYNLFCVKLNKLYVKN